MTAPSNPQSQDPPLKEGDRLMDRYTLLYPLGAGGYSTVFAAHDEQQGRDIAIKILKIGGSHQDPSALARLRQEAVILSQMSHPNILRIYDFVRTDQGAFVTMELLKGRNLAQVLYDDGPAHSEKALPLVKQLLSALATAHDRKILHRDLKPENILLCPTPQGQEIVKLVDFGLAKNYEAHDMDPNEFGVTMVKTRAGGFLGTPRYASPEQAVGDAIGPFTDLFSLGLLVAEWLTGQYRLQGDTHVELLRGLVSHEPINLMDCPDIWRPWLRRLLQKDPAERYQTAQEALSELSAKVEPALYGSRASGDFVFHEESSSYVYGMEQDAGPTASFLDSDAPLELDMDGLEQTQHMPHLDPANLRPVEPTVAMGFTPQETVVMNTLEHAQAKEQDSLPLSTLLIVGALSCFTVLSVLIIFYLLLQ